MNEVTIKQGYDISRSVHSYIATFNSEKYEFTVHLLKDAVTLKDRFMLTNLGFEEDKIIDLFDSLEQVKQSIKTLVLETNGV